MSTILPPTLLATSRIETNRRKIALLVLSAILLAIPFVVGTSFLVAETITWQVTRQAHLDRFHKLRLDRFERGGADLPNRHTKGRDGKPSHDAGLAADMATASEYTPEEKSMRTKLLAVFGLGMTALLGLLLWTSAASPARKLLAAEGARPATAAEREAQHVLEELATHAGMPTPRLYVIETMTMNAFSAGMRPESSVIALTQGLLMALDRDELEGVLAHELSLIANLDTRLNMFVAWYSLMLRMPYLMRRRHRLVQQLSSRHPSYKRFRLGYWLAMAPVFGYVFALAPLVAALVRRSVAFGREFLADADAAALTKNREALMRGLGKIAGAGSSLEHCNPALSHFYFADPSVPGSTMGLLHDNLFAPQPPLEQRVERLAENGGLDSAASVEAAFDAGRKFHSEHPLTESALPAAGSADELIFVSSGNPMGRVFRVISEGTPIYDRDSTSSMVVDRVKRGDLLVVFDDPGKMRQVITAKQIFGYIPFSVKLRQEDLLPSEIQNVGVHNNLPEAEPHAVPEGVAHAPAPLVATAARVGLTARQMFVCAGFGIVVFAGMLVALVELGGK